MDYHDGTNQVRKRSLSGYENSKDTNSKNDYQDNYLLFEQQKSSVISSTDNLIKIDDDENPHVLDNHSQVENNEGVFVQIQSMREENN